MKSKFVRGVSFALTMTLLVSCSSKETVVKDDDKLDVYASFGTMYMFVDYIAEDKINLTNLVPSGASSHDFEITPSDMVNLENADMLVYNGAGFENWVENVQDSLENKDITYVEASNGFALIENENHEEEHEENHEEEHEEEEHEHGIYNPHVWLDVEGAKYELNQIAVALADKDPKNSEFYMNNYNELAVKLDELDDEFRTTIDTLDNKDIVVSHDAYGYMCQAYGLNEISVEGASYAEGASLMQMANITDYINDNNVKAIYYDGLVMTKSIQSLSNETGAEILPLYTLESFTTEQINNNDDYFSIMRSNLEMLKKGLND